MIRFGPAGNSLKFYEDGSKRTEQAPKWLHDMGLSAYEYQCGQGVRVGADTADAIRLEALKYDIALSLHAPYFISMASADDEKRENSITYIMQSLEAAKNMEAKRVIFHPGGIGKLPREAAMERVSEIFKRIILQVYSQSREYEEIILCPEVMGKINQLGDVDETLELCLMDERLIPAFDFGHINARTFGSLKNSGDFEDLLNKIENKLGVYRMKNLHCHFSRIQYSSGGEVKHLNYTDEGFGPEFEPFAEALIKKDASPVIICESAGNQAIDAVTFKNIYENMKNKK